MIRQVPTRALVIAVLALPLTAMIANADGTHDRGGGAFGVAPTDVAFGGIVRGEPIVRMIEVQNARDEPARVNLSREGELGQWVQLSEESFTIPGRTTRTIELRVVAPADAPNGAYAGRVVVRLEPARAPSETESELAVALAIPVKLDAAVGGAQVLRVSGAGLHVPDVEEGSRVPVSLIVTNTGNVYAAPVLEAEVLDRDGRVMHAALLQFPRVAAGETANVTERLEAPLLPGQYWMRGRLVLAGETVMTETVTFDVLAFGELRRKGEMGAIATADVMRKPNHRLPAGADFLVLIPFRNTGEVDVEARFDGYIAEAGRVVRPLQPDALRVAPGEDVTFRILVSDVKDAGTYHIVGAVQYGGKVTPENEAILTLEAGSSARGTPAAGVGGVMLAAGAAALVIAMRRRV